MAKRVLLTGSGGFAGRYLTELCIAEGDFVVATVHSQQQIGNLSEVAPKELLSCPVVDLLEGDPVRRLVAEQKPDTVYHLAALASVGRSWETPKQTVVDNISMTANLLESVRLEAPNAKVVVVGSGELYGPPDQLPVDELATLKPQNPYAVSKASADLLAGFYADAHGMSVFRVRAFNHAGPGQSPTYAISAFAKQAAEGLARGNQTAKIVTGNPESRRDFTDVRDVVRAYRLLSERADPGTYNVCSGKSVSIRELVQLIGRAASLEIEHVVDEKLVRKHDVSEIRGSNERLVNATAWQPEVPLEQTLKDSVEWWLTKTGQSS